MIRNDRKIAVALLLLAIAFTAFFWVFGDYKANPLQKTADSIFSQKKTYRPKRPVQYYATETRKAERFPFDPNTADSTQLLRLGLQPWQVRNIYKFRAHGGIYRQKEDFARLYGLTVKQYRELEPYIRISSDYLPAATLVGEHRKVERDTLRYPVKIQADEHVVLNTADTTQLKKVPGIVPTMPARLSVTDSVLEVSSASINWTKLKISQKMPRNILSLPMHTPDE